MLHLIKHGTGPMIQSSKINMQCPLLLRSSFLLHDLLGCFENTLRLSPRIMEQSVQIRSLLKIWGTIIEILILPQRSIQQCALLLTSLDQRWKMWIKPLLLRLWLLGHIILAHIKQWYTILPISTRPKPSLHPIMLGFLVRSTSWTAGLPRQHSLQPADLLLHQHLVVFFVVGDVAWVVEASFERARGDRGGLGGT